MCARIAGILLRRQAHSLVLSCRRCGRHGGGGQSSSANELIAVGHNTYVCRHGATLICLVLRTSSSFDRPTLLSAIGAHSLSPMAQRPGDAAVCMHA